MTFFLLILSLFLNVMVIFAVILLFLRQNRLMESEKKQEKMFREMEEVLSSYLVLMKEENAEFINKVKNIGIATSPIPKVENDKPDSAAPPSNDEQESTFQNRIGKASAFQAVKAYRENSQKADGQTDKKEDHADREFKVEPTLLNQVLLLIEKGFTEDEIAKKLKKGKTEIALLLKFRQNQQE